MERGGSPDSAMAAAQAGGSERGCIFCDIVARSSPAHIKYEDENNNAFLDHFT